MLRIEIPKRDGWDEVREEFVEFKGGTLQLEHSLVSMSKWESIWHKPFLDKFEKRTQEEFLSYVQCMNMTQNVDPEIFSFLTPENYKQITDYIQNPMTATTFREDPNKHGRSMGSGNIVTSEYLYYMMIDAGVPWECQKWHLNRLMTLLKICAVKRQEENKKMPKNEQMSRFSAAKAASRMRK